MRTITTKEFEYYIQSAIDDITDDSRGLIADYQSVVHHITKLLKVYDEDINDYCDKNYDEIIYEMLSGDK